MATSPRIIHANYDEQSIVVYQAFNDKIADEALAKGTFGEHFRLDRMTWIKPSLGWMLYRSGYATKTAQERILGIRIDRAGFEEILRNAVPSAHDPALFSSPEDWKRALGVSNVRYQWDIDRDLWLRPMPRRALQLGIRGKMVRRYVSEWILRMEDMTAMARAVHAAIKTRTAPPAVLTEEPYALSPILRARLGMQ